MLKNTIKSMPKDNKVTVRLSDTEYAKLIKIAKINNLSISDQIRRIINSINI